jgi:D-glycero-D-manno-heptose 1,7-bisphosphate phosphatase
MRPSELVASARLVIFDADGTLRRTTVAGQPCPHADDEWELIPGVQECLTAIEWNRLDVAVGVASNQDHVGYGLLRDDIALKLLSDMIAAATTGAVHDAEIRFCPHRLEEPCNCRKPAPGMLLDIMRARRVSPAHTLFVGDSPVDEAAARAAGVRFVWAGDFFATPDAG